MIKCECCEEKEGTETVHGWISSISGLTGRVVYLEGTRIYYDFKGVLCPDCKFDFIRAEDEPEEDDGRDSEERHMAFEIKSARGS